MSAPVARWDARIDALDEDAMRRAKDRLDRLTKPRESLGRIESLAIQLVGITRQLPPPVARKAVAVFAADHGVAVEGVSAYPQSVTAQMVANFLRGGAAINVLARRAGARVMVVDIGVAADVPSHPALVEMKLGRGTANLADGPAMTREQARAAIEAGAHVAQRLFADGVDVIGIGEMGIANTTASSAITAVLTGQPIERVTGRGTGIDEAAHHHKLRVIERALAVNHPDATDPLDVLAKVGGFEIGGLIGVILAAAQLRIPILVDGFITGAAALLAATMESHVVSYLIASHCSQEPGHRVILETLRLRPLLELDLRLGEGTGAALAMPLLDAAAAILGEMATFDEAGVDTQVR